MRSRKKYCNFSQKDVARSQKGFIFASAYRKDKHFIEPAGVVELVDTLDLGFIQIKSVNLHFMRVWWNW